MLAAAQAASVATNGVRCTAAGIVPGGRHDWLRGSPRSRPARRPRAVFLIHDRDSDFAAGFDAVFRPEGLEVI